jgi:hypothetical protein
MDTFADLIAAGRGTTPRRSMTSVLGRILLNAVFLLVAVAAFIAYEHFSVQGLSTWATGSLLLSAGFGLAPVRALVQEIFTLQHKALHLVHGLGGLAMIGLIFSGGVQGRPLLTRTALAPFAMMGAAQAVMHQNQPRNAEQAEALRRFATSLPEIEAFTKGDLTSPENARRAVIVLTDLVGKAQALGETELRADPGFQSAVAQLTTRFGLSLGLDAIDQTIGSLSANPAVSKQLPELRRRVAQVRRTVAE